MVTNRTLFTPEEILGRILKYGRKTLRHANSVLTAKTFVDNGGLLSRGFIEENGYFQTRQPSDEVDKQFDIWNDHFFNLSDQHKRFGFGKPNTYGPISFLISIEDLLPHLAGRRGIGFCVPTCQPMYWNRQKYKRKEKWLHTLEEFDALFEAAEEGKSFRYLKHDKWPDIVMFGIDRTPLDVCRQIEIEDLPHDQSFCAKVKKLLLSSPNGSMVRSKLEKKIAAMLVVAATIF